MNDFICFIIYFGGLALGILALSIFYLYIIFRKATKYINVKTDKPFSKEELTLLPEDIDLITPILNKHLQTLDRENECGYSLTTDYWSLMLKLHRIKSVLEEQNDINKNGSTAEKKGCIEQCKK